MLALKNIRKDYPAGDGTVHALQGIDLQFRENEFVSILGPSGCGKTTMLNIIGGLDQYTEGDLIINGRSTKDFKDRDWDAYRNHSIGFVFQSYNLIPHQTVLQNVELALTLSGVNKSERKKRAIAALRSVGLGDQLKKRPAQMSGGQMQRVAIARALVNNPDIILADEPTGALDSETSVQVMDILKEVAKDRLVIMVTHNPDLAEQYSTRIIRMMDGVLQGDSNPLTEQELAAARPATAEKTAPKKRAKKPSMKFTTAFGLSLKNLAAKRSRTTLTSFAGSIGIIGIALIYAVSNGMTTYINVVQEETLSSYPLTIQQTNIDLSSVMTAFMDSAGSDADHDRDAVYSKPLIYNMVNALSNIEATENDLASFKSYIEQRRADTGEDSLSQIINGVQYSYNLNLLIYTKNVDGSILESDATKLLQTKMLERMGMSDTLLSASSGSPLMSMTSSYSTVWTEMLPGDNGQPINDLILNQYDLIYGSWPNDYNEVVLILDENNELDDMSLYALGLTSEADMNALMDAAINHTSVETPKQSWSYQDICSAEYRTILPSDCYTCDEVTGTYTDLRESDTGLRYLYDNGTVLKVTGIIRAKEDALSPMLTGSIGYTSMLTEYVITESHNSAAVLAQQKTPDTDIFTGLPFAGNTDSMNIQEKATAFRAYVEELSEDNRAETYLAISSIPSEEQKQSMVTAAMEGITPEIMRSTIAQAMAEQTGMNADDVTAYIDAMSDEDLTELFTQQVTQQVLQQYAAEVRAKMAGVPTQQLTQMLTSTIENATDEELATWYAEIPEFSDSDYESNLITLGCVDLASPSGISLYAATFEDKDKIVEAINDYNRDLDELEQIQYTDYVGLMMRSVNTIINAITYVLIAFVGISLVVSSIMIGVITLISVQERTKEIGILRAIGASKKNVSSMFNAETLIIGFSSGALGVVITWLLCFPINALLNRLTGIANLKAVLPWQTAVLLIGISILLSVFAGFIPANSAAKKDPVVALRTE